MNNLRDLDRLFLCDDATFRTVMKISRKKLERMSCELGLAGWNPLNKTTYLFSLLYYLTDVNSSFHQLAVLLGVEQNMAEILIENAATAVADNLKDFARIEWRGDMIDEIPNDGFPNIQKSSITCVCGVLGHEILDVSGGPPIMIQLVVSHRGLIRYFKVGCTTNPVELLKSSTIYDLLGSNNQPCFALCDASYPRLHNLIPPNRSDNHFEENEYNETHLKTRQIISKTFNNLFCCFPKLKTLEKPSFAIVVAALVLYNIVINDD